MAKSGHQTDIALAKVLREVQEVESRENSVSVAKDLPFRPGFVQLLTERFHDLGGVPSADTSLCIKSPIPIVPQTIGSNLISTVTNEPTVKVKEKTTSTSANSVTFHTSHNKSENLRTNHTSAANTTTVFIIPKNGGPIMTEKISTIASSKLPSKNGYAKIELIDAPVPQKIPISVSTKTPVVNIHNKDAVDAVINSNITFRALTTQDEDKDLPVKNIVRDRLNMFEKDNSLKASSRIPLSYHRSNRISSEPSSSQLTQKSAVFSTNSSKIFTPLANISVSAIKSVENGDYSRSVVMSVSTTTIVSPSPSFPTLQTASHQQKMSNGISSSERWKSWDDIPKPVTKVAFDNAKRIELSNAELMKIRKAGKSWIFGKNLNELEEQMVGAKIVEIRGNAQSNKTVEQTRPSVSVKTQERLAQETFWDAYRSTDQDKLVAHDSDLAEEARQLMLQQNADIFDDEDSVSICSIGNGNNDIYPVEKDRYSNIKSILGKRKLNTKLRFAVESQLETTFEYQSEGSLIAELGITPDYPLETFIPNMSEDEESAATDVIPLHLNIVKPGLSLATYNKTANVEYNWGAVSSNSESDVKVAPSVLTLTSDSVDFVDSVDTVVFSSAASDLLF